MAREGFATSFFPCMHVFRGFYEELRGIAATASSPPARREDAVKTRRATESRKAELTFSSLLLPTPLPLLPLSQSDAIDRLQREVRLWKESYLSVDKERTL